MELRSYGESRGLGMLKNAQLWGYGFMELWRGRESEGGFCV